MQKSGQFSPDEQTDSLGVAVFTAVIEDQLHARVIEPLAFSRLCTTDDLHFGVSFLWSQPATENR